MKNTTVNPVSWVFRNPMRAAWCGTLAIFMLTTGVLLMFPSLRQSVITLTPLPKPDPEELERRRAQIKKPEPTEKQVREIAERVEKKKKDELRRKIRTLEVIREEIEKTAEVRQEVLGAEPPDVFKALVEAIQKKAQDLESSGILERETGNLRRQSDGLSQFDSMESPGLDSAARDLIRAVRSLDNLLTQLRERLPDNDSHRRTRVERAKGHARQMEELVQRLIRFVAENGGRFEPLSDEALQAMEAAELYTHAQALDEAIRQAFTDARAAELAAVQEMSLADALARVDVPTGATPDLAGELAQNHPATREEFQAYNQALDRAVAAMTAMELAAQGMAAQAQGFVREGQVQESARAAQLQQALHAAAAAPEGAVVDMTPMMRQLYALQRSNPGQAGTGVLLSEENPLMWGGAGTTMGVSSVQSEERMPPLQNRQIIPQLLPGRKFSRSSERRGWLYIDTWYVIGPFQKPEGDRLSYETRFPPETRVDLDAEYPGKLDPRTNRPLALRWHFSQSNTLRITPPDEIDGSVYYAYTEVWFEQDEEVLVAVASDDAAKVWINDLVVWEDTGLSSWRLDEGFRKVLFRRGYNTVLVRIENGPVVCQFSLLLCPVGLQR